MHPLSQLLSSLVIGNAVADYESLKRGIEIGISNLASENSTRPLDKAFSGVIRDFFDTISSYGCWCYLNTADWEQRGRGLPRDSIDMDCKICQKSHFDISRCKLRDSFLFFFTYKDFVNNYEIFGSDEWLPMRWHRY